MADHILSLAQNLGTSSYTGKPAFGRLVNQLLAGGRQALLKFVRGGVATPAGNLTVHGANVRDPWANRTDTNLFQARKDVSDATLVAADYQFTTNIDYAAFSNYNWFIMLDEFARLVVPVGTSLGAVISNASGKARDDFTSETDTGDGATTVFDLAADYNLLAHLDLQVQVNSVVQAASAFSLSDNGGKIRVTFTAAPGNTLPINYQLYPKPNKQFGVAFTTVDTIASLTTVPQGVREIATKDAMWVVTGSGVTGTIEAWVETF